MQNLANLQLLAQSMALFVEIGLLSPEALKKDLICPDGLTLSAASAWSYSTASCPQRTRGEPRHHSPALTPYLLPQDVFLHTIYAKLHARRAVDLRAHPTDQDKTLCPPRGYDNKGRPICSFDYALKANGFDFDRQRRKKLPPPQAPDLTYPSTAS